MKTLIALAAAFMLYVQPAQADEFYPTKTHSATYAGSSTSITTPTSSYIDVLQITCTTACYIALASTPTTGNAGMAAYAATPSATETTSVYIPANFPHFYRVGDGRIDVAVIQVSTGGTLYVTELSK